MRIETLLDEARRRGLLLEPLGADKLAVSPDELLDPGFAAVLRRHKPMLLAYLRRGVVHLALQILSGEFVGCDDSTRASLTIRLRGIRHPLCDRALERLRAQTTTGL
jgi:hypothetical protein